MSNTTTNFENLNCECGNALSRVGEDVSERLDYIPAEFVVERHVRGKWVCMCCKVAGVDVLVQAPVDPHVIDKGIPSAGLVAHTVVAHLLDHLPYYRQETINARSGVHTPRNTLAAWVGQCGAQIEALYLAHCKYVLEDAVLHADETPIPVLEPGKGKTARGYIWAYAKSPFSEKPGVVYKFCNSRAAHHAQDFLKTWCGTLVCDDYAGYKGLFKLYDQTEAGCMAHARRKFDDLIKASQSPAATEAVQRIALLYAIESAAKNLSPDERLALRQSQGVPIAEKLHQWMLATRQQTRDGSALAKALDYSLRRWGPITHYLSDPHVAIDNNHIENQMRPWALGRKNWLFCGSEKSAQRQAMLMSLLQSAKLNGHEPWQYLKDVLERLPTHPNQYINDLLPHLWKPAGSDEINH
jgi:transposase